MVSAISLNRKSSSFVAAFKVSLRRYPSDTQTCFEALDVATDVFQRSWRGEEVHRRVNIVGCTFDASEVVVRIFFLASDEMADVFEGWSLGCCKRQEVIAGPKPKTREDVSTGLPSASFGQILADVTCCSSQNGLRFNPLRSDNYQPQGYILIVSRPKHSSRAPTVKLV